jgi:CRP-like cAMP-binding protein
MLKKEDLAKISLFYRLSDAEKEEIALITDRKEFPKDTSIIREDGFGGEFFIIHKGKVAINRVISARGYQTLAVLKKKDFIV